MEHTTEKIEHTTEKIELHHHSIEEIMGTPPVKSVAVGSGLILLLMLILLAASLAVSTPSIIRTEAAIHGQMPLAVLTASQEGHLIFINKIHAGQQIVQQGDTILLIAKDANEDTVPLLAPVTGIFKVNPLARIRENVSQYDTVGYIQSIKNIPVVCSLQLPDTDARNVRTGQPIRIFMDDGNSKNFIEAEITEISSMATTNRTQIIAVLTDKHLHENLIRGVIHASAEITTGRQSLFHQLINPFRGLKK
jgi:hypothetical protein